MDYNEGGMIVGSPSVPVFIVPKSGIYSMSLNVRRNTATHTLSIGLRKNGDNNQLRWYNVATSGMASSSFSSDEYLEEGEKIEPYMNYTSASTFQATNGTTFSIRYTGL